MKKYSAAYLHQSEKTNARKGKFLDKMTSEKREIKRAKYNEYYQKKKKQSIVDMSEREKQNRKQI